jgi:formylmethanofuran dehydrogenase subunit B
MKEEKIQPPKRRALNENMLMDSVQKLNNFAIFCLVGITTDYGLDGCGLVPGLQASYPMGAAGPLHRDKAAGA